jgi:YD repeat-containing protein
LTDWTGRVVRYGYDASKRLTSVTDAAGKVTTYAYDSSHKLTKITDPLLQETRITYYQGSNDRFEVTVKRVTDPATGAGSTTLYQTCPRGQEVCPPEDPSYWEAGQTRTLVTDPNNNKTLFYTDLHSRVWKLKDALMRVQSIRPPRPRRGAGSDAATNYCNCGWPFHLLVPRGTSEGMPFRLLIMLTDWELDRVPDESSCGSMSFCGVRDRRYPDRRPMGYPFDRPFPSGIANAVAGQQTMATRDITIRHLP